jgi:hypothetical protein
MPDPRYNAIHQKTVSNKQQRDRLTEAQLVMLEGRSLTAEQAKAVAAAKSVVAGLSLLGPTSPQADTAAAIMAYVNYLDSQIENFVKQLYSLDEEQAYNDYPEYLSENASSITAQRKLFGGSDRAPVQAYSFTIGPGGNVIRTNSITGAVEILDTKVPQGSQIVTNQRDGHAYAINKDTGDRVDLGVVAFPEIDPEQRFRLDVLSQAAQVESNLAGIDLQQRSLMIKALGDDNANMVTLGRMRYEESALNLNRLNSAFDQRRAEREQVLRYGVAQSSLRAGGTMSQLPLSPQLANMLSGLTGQQFSEADFQLPVSYVSPDQAANDVLAGTAYDSPIAGLSAAFSQSRQMIENILGKPLGSRAASEQLMAAAMPPS